MNLCKAINVIKSRGLTPWMAYAIIKRNNDYIICDTAYIKRFPNLEYVYMKKGKEFPKNALFIKRLHELLLRN